MASFADTVRFCFPAAVGGSQPKELPLTNRDGTEAMPNRRDPLDWNDEDLSRGVVKFSFVAAIKTYAPDWLLVAALWGVLAVLNRSPGHKREFSLEDKSIQHSFAEHERVPPKWVRTCSSFGIRSWNIIIACWASSLLEYRSSFSSHSAPPSRDPDGICTTPLLVRPIVPQSSFNADVLARQGCSCPIP
jgi:diacylglycerol diphosphate phosphatase/phosphatidate phosphatase